MPCWSLIQISSTNIKRYESSRRRSARICLRANCISYEARSQVAALTRNTEEDRNVAWIQRYVRAPRNKLEVLMRAAFWVEDTEAPSDLVALAGTPGLTRFFAGWGQTVHA